MNKWIGVLLSGVLFIFAGHLWAGPVNINSADAETLAAELTGVGPEKAAAIVAYREANGPFKSAKDLGAVKGIGEKTLENNRDNIVIAAE